MPLGLGLSPQLVGSVSASLKSRALALDTGPAWAARHAGPSTEAGRRVGSRMQSCSERRWALERSFMVPAIPLG